MSYSDSFSQQIPVMYDAFLSHTLTTTNTETGGARFDANENTLSNQLGR